MPSGPQFMCIDDVRLVRQIKKRDSVLRSFLIFTDTMVLFYVIKSLSLQMEVPNPEKYKGCHQHGHPDHQHCYQIMKRPKVTHWGLSFRASAVLSSSSSGWTGASFNTVVNKFTWQRYLFSTLTVCMVSFKGPSILFSFFF